MADGDIVLAAVDPVGGGAVLVCRVTWSVAAGHLFHPFRRRDAPLLAAEAQQDPGSEVPRSDRLPLALRLDAGAGAPRRGLIADTGAGAPRLYPVARYGLVDAPLLAGENPAFLPAEAQQDPGSQLPRSDRLPLALRFDAGAAMPRRVVVIPDHRLPGAFLLDAGAGAPRRGLIADTGAGAPRLYLVARDRLLGALPVAAMRRDSLVVVAPRGPTYLLAAPHGPRGQQDIRAVLFGDALLAAPGDAAAVVLAPEAQVLGRVLMAALGGDRGMARVVVIPDHRLPGAFLLDAGAGAPRRGLIADTGAGAPRLYLVARDCLLGALPVAAMRRDSLVVVAPRGPTYLLAAPHGPRGQQDIRAALFRDALLAAPGDAAAVVLAPEAQVLGRVLMAALGGDRGMARVVALQLLGAAGEHGVSLDRLVFCVAVGTEDGGHGQSNGRLLEGLNEPRAQGLAAASIDAGGRGNDLPAGVDPVVFSRREMDERMVVRVFDGVDGRLIAATDDQLFGRALLAALTLAPSSDPRADPAGTLLHVILEVEVLGRGISTAGALAQLSAWRGTRGGNGDGLLVSSSAAPTGASLQPATAPSPPSPPADEDSTLEAAITSLTLEIRKLDRRRILRRINSGRQTQRQAERRGNEKMEKFKSLLDSFVFFALPLVLIFYPTKVPGEGTTQEVGLLENNCTSSTTSPTPSAEEKIVVTVIAIFASIWLVGVILARFGRGRRCVSTVAGLTYFSVISIIAFVIYKLSKTPEENVYSALFAAQLVLTISAITFVWVKYVKEPKIHLPSLQGVLQDLRTKWRPTRQCTTQQDDRQENQLEESTMANMV